jgi:hypothetical protein
MVGSPYKSLFEFIDIPIPPNPLNHNTADDEWLSMKVLENDSVRIVRQKRVACRVED